MIGWREGELLLTVRARPVEGKANEALLALLADMLDVPPTALAIASGATSRHKTVEVAGQSQVLLDGLIQRRFGVMDGENAR